MADDSNGTNQTCKLFTDGGARGNPGPAGIGVVLQDSDGTTIFELGKYIGKATNNQAEYSALIEGLKAATEKNISSLMCYLDSELVANQMSGNFKVKSHNIKKYFDEALTLKYKFQNIQFSHVPREENKRADELVNSALDKVQNGNALPNKHQ